MAGGVKMRGVRAGQDTVRALAAQAPFVLAHRGGALRVAVLTVTVGLVDLGSGERALVFARGTPEQEQALAAEAATGVLRAEAALSQAELVLALPATA